MTSVLAGFGFALWLCAMSAIASDARHWTPDAVSTTAYESSPAFTPDGRELFFMRADRSFQNYQLLWAECLASGWSAPLPPPFAAPAPVLEGDPFVTADGNRVYFISSRYGFAHGRGNDDLDIWFADRLPDGRWSNIAHRLPEPVNSTDSELLPRQVADGRLYFGSARPGGLGGMDIYSAQLDRKGGWSVSNLGQPINTDKNEYEAEVSPDQLKLILVADRGDRSHLYLFTRQLLSEAWAEQTRLPAHSSVFQVGPLLSPSADRLLFAQAEDTRSGEFFLLDLASAPDPKWPPTCSPAVK